MRWAVGAATRELPRPPLRTRPATQRDTPAARATSLSVAGLWIWSTIPVVFSHKPAAAVE